MEERNIPQDMKKSIYIAIAPHLASGKANNIHATARAEQRREGSGPCATYPHSGSLSSTTCIRFLPNFMSVKHMVLFIIAVALFVPMSGLVLFESSRTARAKPDHANSTNLWRVGLFVALTTRKGPDITLYLQFIVSTWHGNKSINVKNS